MLLASTFAIPAVGRSCVARSARSSVRVRTLRSVIVNNSNRRVTKTNRPTRSPPPSQEPDEEELSTLEKAALVSGLVATPVALYSEFVLKTTGTVPYCNVMVDTCISYCCTRRALDVDFVIEGFPCFID